MFDVVIVAYGKSQRAGLDKLSFDINGQSILSRTISSFENIEGINNIIVVTDRAVDKENIIKVCGGETRSQSVMCGLKCVQSPYVLIHDGARPFVSYDLIKRVMQATKKYQSAVPYVTTTDSLRGLENNKLVSTFDREKIVGVQTPQGYQTALIKQAYKLNKDHTNTDESEIFARFIAPPYAVTGEIANKKITHFEDLAQINSRIGTGFDTHAFESGKPLVLGGVKIPFDRGLKAHSDGDVVIHSVMDALLSAVGERDIGTHFPDADNNYKDIDSTILLAKAKKIIDQHNVTISNIAIVIMAQAPKLSSYIDDMRQNIASILNIEVRRISISATTTENLGLIGQEKAIAVLAIANVV